ncbi:MAG: MarR family transcriptional regulator [Clostridiales bacterium]|nr:MarR family transcriptional regulator [Clostridiales bacterium]
MDAFSRELNDLLVTTFWSVLKVEEQMLKADRSLNLSINELHLIESVGKEELSGKTISDIALDLGITRPSATVSINKLVEKGYVNKRKDSTDGRLVYVTLTDTGKKVDHVHSYFHIQMVREISKTLDDKEKDVLMKGLTKLNAFFQIKADRGANG